ncbi:mechanosensitive ion channel family protein [bacterium]|nr:mechanosensitive ion channel family protein [bacterium]
MTFTETFQNIWQIYQGSFLHTIVHSKPFNITLALIILYFVIRGIKFVLNKLTGALINVSDDEGHKKQLRTLFDFLQTLVLLVVGALYIMTLLSKLGIDIAPILTAAGVLGVAVGFGAKRLVEDVITGVILLIEGQIRVGDYVKIGNFEGFVERFDLKLVVLRSYSGELNYIRNGMIDVVVNCSRGYMNYIGEIGVSYKEDIDNVIATLKEIFNEKLVTNPKFKHQILGEIVVLGLNKFDDSSIVIKYQIKSKPMCHNIVGREFNRLIKKTFDEKGIEIPFPQRVLHIQKED